jgi:hypothetical protein
VTASAADILPGHDTNGRNRGAGGGKIGAGRVQRYAHPMATCRLCGKSVGSISDVLTPGSPNYMVQCRRCGIYEADDGAWNMFASMSTDPADRHLLSALTRTAPIRQVVPVLIDASSYVALREGRIREPTFADKSDALLDWIAFESRKNHNVSAYGARVSVDPQLDYPVAYCRPTDTGNADEWNFVFHTLVPSLVQDLGNGQVRITETGWRALESRPKASGALGFVAMKFIGMDDLYAAISEGIARAGYKPTRIDREDYIGGVMDQIVAKIRESRFVVADFTGNRGGVYYEAGFALGLNLPVFTLCRHDNLSGADPIHFDVQHLNLLTWENGKLAELTARLEARIVAVLGRGPMV